MEMNKVLCKN